MRMGDSRDKAKLLVIQVDKAKGMAREARDSAATGPMS